MNDSLRNEIYELRNISSYQMCLETGIDVDQCYAYLSLFLNDFKAEDLYNVQISTSKLDDAASVKAGNIIRNIDSKHFLDIAEGLAIALDLKLSDDKDLAVKSILAMIFFVRALRKLSTVSLTREQALFLIAVKQNEQDFFIDRPERMLQQINSVLKDYGSGGEFFSEEKCNDIYRALNELGIVTIDNNKLILLEKVTIDGGKGNKLP